MTRRYARAPKGERAYGVVSPVTASANTTLLLASMGVEGMGACLVVEGATTKVIFEAYYVERVLAPALSPGQVVVIDNLLSPQGLSGARACRGTGL